MRVGITSPVVTANPGSHSAWEQSAGPTELARIASIADRAGLDHLTCSEHVAIPRELASTRGATYWDPAVTLSFLAAHTERIRLVTQVLVLGYHHPLQVAKQFGTLDLVSAGRLVLGVGVGSLEEEFALLGATYAGRGTIADDALRAIRASLGRSEPEYHGSHFDFAGFVVEPHAPRTDIPVWVGGRSARSLRRAIELGAGWNPFGLSGKQITQLLAGVKVPDHFEVVLSPGGRLDPGSDPEMTADRLRQLRGRGATTANVALAAESAEHYCEQVVALAELAAGID